MATLLTMLKNSNMTLIYRFQYRLIKSIVNILKMRYLNKLETFKTQPEEILMRLEKRNE